MKSFQLIQTIGSFVVILVMIIVWGVPLAPTIMYYQFVNELVLFENEWAYALGTGLVLSSSFVVYSICLLLFSSLLQFILHVRVKEKIVVPLASFTTIRWAFCGQILRATQPFLQHFVPSFLSNAYFRISGAKIGKNTQINTFRLNDPSLIRIDDDCVVGGGAIFNGHLVEKGQLVFAPIHMKKGSLVGSGATIQPGVTVEEEAVVATNALVPKYRTIPAGEVWGGLPAVIIRDSSSRD
jgi:acetyltransferase-like isoleucine patch superfamily enzyme